MNRRSSPRIVALLLIFALTLPSSASAMRISQGSESTARTGLEEALRPVGDLDVAVPENPKTGLEEKAEVVLSPSDAVNRVFEWLEPFQRSTMVRKILWADGSLSEMVWPDREALNVQFSQLAAESPNNRIQLQIKKGDGDDDGAREISITASPAKTGLEEARGLGVPEAVAYITQLGGIPGLKLVMSPWAPEIDLSKVDPTLWSATLEPFVSEVMEASNTSPKGIHVKILNERIVVLPALRLETWEGDDADDVSLFEQWTPSQHPLSHLFEREAVSRGRLRPDDAWPQSGLEEQPNTLSVEERIVQIVADNLGIPVKQVTPTLNIGRSDSLWDIIDAVERTIVKLPHIDIDTTGLSEWTVRQLVIEVNRVYVPVGGLEERVPLWLTPVVTEQELPGLVSGVREAADVTHQPVAIFLDPELLGPEEEGFDYFVVRLISLRQQLRAALSWSEEIDLQFELLPGEHWVNLRNRYQNIGYRVIEIKRSPASVGQEPLPWAALPVVVAQAISSGETTFLVDVTPYLGLRNKKLPEVLSTLTDLFA